MSTYAVVGAGVIGASWAALFLAHGHDVVVADPAGVLVDVITEVPMSAEFAAGLA